MTNNTTFKDIDTVYCAGCSYGLINKLIAETIDVLGLREKTIIVNSQGCTSFGSDYLNVDFIEAPAGMATSVATGLKKVYPEKIIITYQGDGDLLFSGMDSLIHTASRGEKITTFLINNLNMANIGGYMSPTSIVGQVTKTTPYSRSIDKNGKQIKISEIISRLQGSAFVARVSTDNNERMAIARKTIEEALLFQIEGKGFTFIEFLAMCPTYWNKSPVDSRKWVQETLIHQFPVSTIKRTLSK
ncbi:MAG: thiamine pyrophosphate-dependent enzyme [Candidatus Sericytochromatia bacterium]